jgi:hypothetical protein
MPLALTCHQGLGEAIWTVSAEPGYVPGPSTLRAAAERSLIPAETDGLALPPAGASRAETLFTTVGMTLMLAIGLSALWILLRGRR